MARRNRSGHPKPRPSHFLRSTMQSRDRWILLFSGSHTPDELEPYWCSYSTKSAWAAPTHPPTKPENRPRPNRPSHPHRHGKRRPILPGILEHFPHRKRSHLYHRSPPGGAIASGKNRRSAHRQKLPMQNPRPALTSQGFSFKSVLQTMIAQTQTKPGL